MSSDTSPTPMNELKLTVYHPDLEVISDRTLRFLLKKMTSLSRDIQTAEVAYLVNRSDLSASEKQSISDRVTPALGHMPGYYVERISKGSIEIAVALTAIGIWLLQTTIGKSVEEAYKKTRMHQAIVDYLSSDKRKEVIEQNFDTVVNSWTVDRFFVDHTEKEIDREGDIVINIFLSTATDVKETLDVKRIDVDFVLNQGKQQIAQMRKATAASAPKTNKNKSKRKSNAKKRAP